MSDIKNNISMFSGFYKKTVDERINILKEYANLTDEDISILKSTGSLAMETSNRMVENCIGNIHIPLGLATNFKINGKYYVVPMAIEEPSVIAAASKAAKLTLPSGFKVEADEPVMRGQIQIMNTQKNAEILIDAHESEIEARMKEYAKGMEKYGGGYKRYLVRRAEYKPDILLFEFFVNVSNAMGANTINTIAEKIAPYLEEITGGKVRLRILTNLSTERMVNVRATWKKDVIGVDGVNGVYDGYIFALSDIYRATTNNKGIMNGIDAVALATGNDWRAIEAGAHAYASLSGRYKPLAKYKINENGDLEGYLAMPLAVATVGGATSTLKTAKLSRKILGVTSSKELAMVMSAVGLANNFAALYALSTEGIQRGHMKLHSRNIAVMAGAKTPDEIDNVSRLLNQRRNYSVEFAKSILEEIRAEQRAKHKQEME